MTVEVDPLRQNLPPIPVEGRRYRHNAAKGAAPSRGCKPDGERTL